MRLLRRVGQRFGLTPCRHVFKWSEVKAAKQGGPNPKCRFCGRRVRHA